MRIECELQEKKAVVQHGPRFSQSLTIHHINSLAIKEYVYSDLVTSPKHKWDLFFVRDKLDSVGLFLNLRDGPVPVTASVRVILLNDIKEEVVEERKDVHTWTSYNGEQWTPIRLSELVEKGVYNSEHDKLSFRVEWEIEDSDNGEEPFREGQEDDENDDGDVVFEDDIDEDMF